MDDQDLVDGLRGITLADPPLGFDPDEVATRAARRQRNRRASVAAGLGTVAAVVVAFVLTTTNGPAAQMPVPAPPAQRSPDPAVRAQVQPILDHLDDVFPSIVPAAKEISPATGGRSQASQREVLATKRFWNEDGPATIQLFVAGKVAGNRHVQENVCQSYETCDRHPQPDGSVVVTEFMSFRDVFAYGTILVTHYRTDGSRVTISTSNGHSSEGTRVTMPLSEQQAITLVTDPAFTVDQPK